MNAIIKLEVIGDDCHAYMWALNRGKIKYPKIREMCRAMKYGQTKYYPSVTCLENNGRNLIERMMKDYSHAKNLGFRGVFDWYTLEPGQYKIRQCIGLGMMQIKYITVNLDGSIHEGNNA